jgi:Tfp pilus assembly protein PilN
VINLLSPELKKQMKYAKMNRVGLRYLRVTIAVVFTLAIVFGGALYLLKQHTDEVARDVVSKQAEIDSISKDFLPKAKDASERLNAIKYVQDTQTKFSLLITDLAKALPKDVYIESIRLSGNDKLPVALSVKSSKYDQILALRNSLATSPRISAADIVSITGNTGADGKPIDWTGSLVLGFKPGQAK